MKKKITVIGSGALGSALANVLKDSNKNHDILIYGIDEKELKDLEKGKNTKYFEDLKLNKFKTTNNLEKAIKDAEYLVFALPSTVIDEIMDQVIEHVSKPILIINGSKGFYPNSKNPLHEGMVKKSAQNKYIRGIISIAGPSFAIEIAKKSLTSIAAIGYDKDQIKEVQNLFKTSYFKLYGQSDVIGAEVGGIYKNILALGSGILSAMGYKINTISLYLTRGMKELAVFNNFMGGKEKTIYGLTGMGDLILTATDVNSRNFTFGLNFINKKENPKNVTLEGLTALKVVEEIRVKNKLKLPIEEALYNVLYKGKKPEDEIKRIWEKGFDEEE